jgi:hypothetical protein
MSHIEPEPSTSASGIIGTPQRTIKEEEGASGLEVQDFGVVAGPYRIFRGIGLLTHVMGYDVKGAIS